MNRNFTKEEAERIFSLAAEKQQAKRKQDFNQLSLHDLEEAGEAAGIDPAFIRQAASDLLRPDRITEERNFFGFPVELRESHIFPFEFTEENWKKSVDVFTHVYEKAGKTTQIGTTKRWSSEQNENQMPANIIAEKEEHGTRITIERKLWPMTLGFGLASVINAIIGIIFTTLSFTVGDVEELIIPGSIMLGLGLIFGLVGTVGMKMVSRHEKKRFANVFKHLDTLEAEQEVTSDSSAITESEHSETLSRRIAIEDAGLEASIPPVGQKQRQRT